MTESDNSLRITEIFYSLQGESLTVGLPTVFVRLTGCPLRCQYCDTAYAFHGGKRRTQTDILAQVAAYSPRYICVTGGEPLAQPGCIALLVALCDAGYQVSLETSGAMPIGAVDPRVARIVDIKTPDSAECDKNLWNNMDLLTHHDQLKFVICSRSDYDWAKFQLDSRQLHARAEQVLFSPSFGQVNATDLANWIIEDNLPVRFQLQLHKLLWNDEPGR